MKNKNVANDSYEVLEYISVNKEKYAERFCLIESGERKFNFCAALFGGVWLVFQFMFLEWSILTMIQFIYQVGLNLLDVWFYNRPAIRVSLDILTILLNIIPFFFLGFFGDKLLMTSIKRKIAFQKKRDGRFNWIKTIYSYEKIVVIRVLCTMLFFGLAWMILGWLGHEIYIAIVY